MQINKRDTLTVCDHFEQKEDGHTLFLTRTRETVVNLTILNGYFKTVDDLDFPPDQRANQCPIDLMGERSEG